MKITPFYRWYDMYIGPYIDLENKTVYLVFLGLGLKFKWGEIVHANQKEIYSPDGSELWAKVSSRLIFERQENGEYHATVEEVRIEALHDDVFSHLQFYKGDLPKRYHLYTGKVSVRRIGKGTIEGRSLLFEINNAEEGLMFDLGHEGDTFFLSQDVHDDLARSGQKEAQLIIRVLE